jgi:stage 0 sporulation protein B (sporulation initiation phosphotransferase)
MNYEQLFAKIVILNLGFIGVMEMSNSSLTVREALRFSNHDLLNHLHLIQMNLDLNRVAEAKDVIHEIAAQCQMFSNANKIGLPKTVEWLQTFKWRFPAIEFTLISDAEMSVNSKWDETIEQYLENTILHVYDTLDPYKQHFLQTTIVSKNGECTIDVKLDGRWQLNPIEKMNTNLTIITNVCTDESWHYVLSIKE